MFLLHVTRDFADVTRTPEDGVEKLLNPGAMVLLMELAFEAESEWLQESAALQLVRLYGSQVIACCGAVGLGKLVQGLRKLPAKVRHAPTIESCQICTSKSCTVECTHSTVGCTPSRIHQFCSSGFSAHTLHNFSLQSSSLFLTQSSAAALLSIGCTVEYWLHC